MPIDRTATLDLIRQRLVSLDPIQLDIVDDSQRHAGHAGAKDGGHFTLAISAQCFAGISTLQRHRIVLDLLGDLRSAGIHAMSIDARAP